MSPIGFEIVAADGSPAYITVCSVFTHHFTGETMRCIRRETFGEVTGHGFADWEIVNQWQFEELLKRRKVNDQT